MAAQIKGKVQGFPTTVPIAEATKLPRKARASSAAPAKWNPMKGVNDIAAPQAKPAAIR